MSEITTQDSGISALNSLIMDGDMSKLNQKEKLDYYHGICKSIGLNPLTKPFDYMKLNGKEVLYATKGAAEQIRNIKGISVTSQVIEWTDDLVIVTVEGKDKDGRVDTETGFAYILEPDEIRTGWDRSQNKPIFSKNSKAGQPLKGEPKGNLLLKAITKAKRRLTLSMAGLGMLDETEVESIPSPVKLNDITSDGEVIEKPDLPGNLSVTPFKIKVTLNNKGDPDWTTWARTYYAHLKAAEDIDLEEWIDLNNDAYGNLPDSMVKAHENISKLIDSRVAKVLDGEVA